MYGESQRQDRKALTWLAGEASTRAALALAGESPSGSPADAALRFLSPDSEAPGCLPAAAGAALLILSWSIMLAAAVLGLAGPDEAG